MAANSLLIYSYMMQCNKFLRITVKLQKQPFTGIMRLTIEKKTIK